jgi:uncharacterized coiled-coil DUF342 family protein
LTEAAETKPDDIEFLRAKLRELKTQARDELDVLRRDRDQMREYKTIRDEHNNEVRGLIESVKAEREERDRINKDIYEAKERRTAIHAQLKSLYDEIRDLRSNLVGSPSTDQRRMMRRVEELEWRQQTDQLTKDEELSIVEEIAKIETKLVKIGQEKEKQDKISELRRLARKLKDEASEAHVKVIKLSEQSQIHHQEVVRIRPTLEEYKKSADTAHKNFVEWLKKVKDGEAKLKELRTQIEDIQGKLRKYSFEKRDVEQKDMRDSQRAEERERTDAAVEKLQSGKRLTFDEFILAQRQVTDIKKKSQKSKKREKKAKPKAIPEAFPEAEPETKTKAKTKSEPKAELESKVKAKAKSEPKAELESKVKAKAKSKPKAEPEAEPETKSKAKPKSEPKAEPEAEPVDVAVPTPEVEEPEVVAKGSVEDVTEE